MGNSSSKMGDIITATPNTSLHNIFAMLIRGNKSVPLTDEDKDGNTALSLAVKNGHTPLIYALLEAGADVNHEDAKGQTPLFQAASRGYDRTVRRLIIMGADVNHQDKDQNTPLIVAAEGGYHHVMHELIRNGAETNHRNVNGTNALMALCDYRKYNLSGYNKEIC